MAAAEHAPSFVADALAEGSRKLFTVGLWNGFGGKVELGETVLQAAVRELQEEACITAKDIEEVGVLTFVFDDNPQPWQVHVFRVEGFEGVPSETEEMRPQWYAVDEIPYQQMWADDEHWYPLFLAGQRFKGLFAFRETTKLVWHELREVQQVSQPMWWGGQATKREA